MLMVHGDFKIGEVSPREGTYACACCKAAGRESTVRVEAGGTFPFCKPCHERGTLEVDVVWKKVS